MISFHLAVVHLATFAKCFSIRPVTGSGYVSGGRLTDAIGVGVLTRLIHRDLVDEVLVQTDRVQKCSRLLPARVVVYYVLALCLFFGDSYAGGCTCTTPGPWASSRGGSIPSCAAGYSTTAGSIGRRCMCCAKRINTYLVRWAARNTGDCTGSRKSTTGGRPWEHSTPGCSLTGPSPGVSWRLDGRSRVTGDCYARFCESPGGLFISAEEE